MTMRPRVRGSLVIVSVAALAPETSNTQSAPAPPVCSLTSATRSTVRASTAFSPRLFASSMRNGFTSDSSTFAPAARATKAMSNPMGPAPRTTTNSPALTSPKRTSWQATDNGSINAACSKCEIWRQSMQRVGRYSPQLLHGPRRIDADEFQVHADMTMPGFTGRAGTAMV